MKKFEKTRTTMKKFEAKLGEKFVMSKMHKRKHRCTGDECWIEGELVVENANGKIVWDYYHTDCGNVARWIGGVGAEFIPTIPTNHKATTCYVLRKCTIGAWEQEDKRECCGEFVDLEEAKRFALATVYSLIELDEFEKDSETGLWGRPEDGGVCGGFRNGELEYMDGITKKETAQ
jgi:hypothetical protein